MEEKRERADEEDLFDEEDEDTQKDKFLTFRLNNEDYGIDIRFVTEIIGLQKITEVPDMPDYIKGVINLRGNVIPVMDVRLRFAIEAAEYNHRTCIIVVNIEEKAMGLVVDTVSEVTNIPADQIEPSPMGKSGEQNCYIRGIGKVEEEVKILLDINKLLYGEELNQVAG